MIKHIPRSSGGRPARAACAGLTLVEVMLAAMVLALGITASIICIQIGARNIDIARTSSAVSQVMQNEFERLRMEDWATVSALPGSAPLDMSTTFSADSVLNGKVDFVREVIDVPGFADMKEIVIRATWDSAVDGKSRTRVYRMRYTKNGLHDYYYSSGVQS